MNLTPEELEKMKDPPRTLKQRLKENSALAGKVCIAPFVWLLTLHRRTVTYYKEHQRERKNLIIYSILLIVISVSLLSISSCVSAYKSTETTVVATVTKTERVSYGSGDNISHKYLVYTDQGTFECTDSVLYMKFDSSDVYGQIQQGRKYSFRVVGWRSGLGSMYQNILEAYPVK